MAILGNFACCVTLRKGTSIISLIQLKLSILAGVYTLFYVVPLIEEDVNPGDLIVIIKKIRNQLLTYDEARFIINFNQTRIVLQILYCILMIGSTTMLYSGNSKDQRAPMLPFLVLSVMTPVALIADRVLVIWTLGYPRMEDILIWIFYLWGIFHHLYISLVVISRHQEISRFKDLTDDRYYIPRDKYVNMNLPPFKNAPINRMTSITPRDVMGNPSIGFAFVTSKQDMCDVTSDVAPRILSNSFSKSDLKSEQDLY